MGKNVGQDQVWIRLTPKQRDALVSVVDSLLHRQKIQKWVMDGGYLHRIKDALNKGIG